MSEWNKLWEGIDWNRVTTIPFINKRIHKIKAEGGKLNELAKVVNEAMEMALDNSPEGHYKAVIKIRGYLESIKSDKKRTST